MIQEDTYKTITDIAEGIYTEKRSKFIAIAIPVRTIEEIKQHLDTYQKKYYDARHVCYAYMLGHERKDFRANDNGEPSGTAGKPILGQINSNELTDILIIVVRYFGGIKLGTSGLIVVRMNVKADNATRLVMELRSSSKSENYTPDTIDAVLEFDLKKDENEIVADFSYSYATPRYAFICLMKNPEISVPMSGRLVTGLTAVYNYINPAVSNFGKQVPPEGIGVEEFEFWCPKRRPESKNIAMSFAPPLASFNSENLRNSYYRPYIGTNAWVAAFDDARPEVCFKWNGRKQIKTIILYFDTDTDQAMETVQMGMGEPLFNYDNLIKAIHILRDRYGLNFPTDGITISTVGPVDQLKKLREEHLKIQLTISLHAATQSARNRIIPHMRIYAIEDVVKQALSYSERHNRKIVFAYLLLPGINDRPSDVRQLAKWFRGKKVMINVLQYNPTSNSRIKAPQKREIVAFKHQLEQAGLEVTMRVSHGREINAACGQLANTYNKFKKK